MKDERVRTFRVALQKLVESLKATARVNRWTTNESIPEPLQQSAAQLLDRLGVADQLASKPFTGSPPDVTRVAAMCATMRRLDAALATYRQHVEQTPTERAVAAMSLEAEVDEVMEDAAGKW